MIGTNLLTKFHEDRKINVASRVLTRKNLLTIFHEDWTINVASRVFTRINAPLSDIIGTNLLTKFHKDLKINVASRVLTRFYYSHKMKNAPPPGGYVFSTNRHHFRTHIIGTNLLSKFHEDRKINVASRVLTRKNDPPPGGHVFQPTGIIFKLVQDIIGMNLLTKKNAPPLGSHVFQANVIIFVTPNTNLLTKFHEDWTINVAFGEFTRQMLTPHNGQKAITKAHHEHVVLR
ncbi:hypothetical protein DPMN_029356 [Dreissena polymorpha]|uniref:Uncharacterized protein n=1 Tax=Dreissena polymorpha TaxID=45954 RepID=A0A9D4RF68_DREPO|nr:hypothetical protein DPMN_029356 [Dreissena polymorpha]